MDEKLIDAALKRFAPTLTAEERLELIAADAYLKHMPSGCPACRRQEEAVEAYSMRKPAPNKETPMSLKARTRSLLGELIYSGITLGYNRAHKHTDHPSEDLLRDKISDAIWELIDESFVVTDDDEVTDDQAR